MKQVNVNHHKQQTGCLKYLFPAIVVIAIMAIMKMSFYSVFSILKGIIIYFLVFKGIPIIWRFLLKSNLKKCNSCKE